MEPRAEVESAMNFRSPLYERGASPSMLTRHWWVRGDSNPRSQPLQDSNVSGSAVTYPFGACGGIRTPDWISPLAYKASAIDQLCDTSMELTTGIEPVTTLAIPTIRFHGSALVLYLLSYVSITESPMTEFNRLLSLTRGGIMLKCL